MFLKQSVFTFSVIVACLPATLASFQILKHGDSLALQNVGDLTYLTATDHIARQDYGVYVGPVMSLEFARTLNQIWDTIRWPNTTENQFWIYTKAFGLNEITAQNIDNFPIPAKNLVEFIYVKKERGNGNFLIRSTLLNKCISSNGPDTRISYEPCNLDDSKQQWRRPEIVEENQDKTDIPCKYVCY